jgi:hypothetical protein
MPRISLALGGLACAGLPRAPSSKLTAGDLAWSLGFILVWVQHDFSYLEGMADQGVRNYHGIPIGFGSYLSSSLSGFYVFHSTLTFILRHITTLYF